MTDSYTEQLEARCEKLQEQLTSLQSGIANFFKLKVVVEKNKTHLYLEVSTPQPPRDGIDGKPVPIATIHSESLCTAVNTTVDDVKRWYLEFCNGDRGHCDVATKPEELGLIIAKKFDLQYVPIEVIIKDPDHVGYRGGDFLDSGYIYAPYIPIMGLPVPPVSGLPSVAGLPPFNVSQMSGGTPGVTAAPGWNPAQSQKSIMQRYAQSMSNQQKANYTKVGIK